MSKNLGWDIFVRQGTAQFPGHGEGTSCGFIILGLAARTGNHKVVLFSPLQFVLCSEYLCLHRPLQSQQSLN